MNKRLAVVLGVSLFVIAGTYLLVNYARGYLPDLQNRQLKPTGLLVATSDPEGAQVFLNGELRTATDDTLNLDPGKYSVEIKKDGFIPWKKQLEIEKELVTQTDAVLFPLTPNLQALTSSGALNPSLSPSGTKLLYVIPEESKDATQAATLPTANGLDKAGLWLLELTNLPLGFNQEAKQLVSGKTTSDNLQLTSNWEDFLFIWSPDSREFLAVYYPETEKELSIDGTSTVLPSEAYLINTGEGTNEVGDLTNIAPRFEAIMADWQDARIQLLNAQIAKLPDDFADLIATSAANLKFSPDETKLLYTATASAQLADIYLPPVPSASTQAEERSLSEGRTYVYDLKEDRNFLILEEDETEKLASCINSQSLNSKQKATGQLSDASCPKLSWYPTSRHLVYFSDGKVWVMEYDAMNKQVIYAGPIEKNFVFVHPSPSKLLLVTNLNPDAFPVANLYTLSLR